MKTKPFLLATAGSTVDGRVIDDKMLDEMASSYDPMTYGARLNIEHIRGISGEKPFRSYGDVLELSVGEVDVNFNGTMEKRKALYGVFDVTDDAKALNTAGQKVYPSIEIEPNFGGKGSAYLMGCALTDSPAAIATERLAFNRTMPGTIKLARDEAASLDFAAATEQAGDGFITKFGAMLDSAFAKFTPAKTEEKPAAKEGETAPAAAFNFAEMRPMFEELGQTFAASIGDLRNEMRGEIDQLGVKLKKIEGTVEATPAQQHKARPVSAGANGQFAKTDC